MTIAHSHTRTQRPQTTSRWVIWPLPFFLRTDTLSRKKLYSLWHSYVQSTMHTRRFDFWMVKGRQTSCTGARKAWASLLKYGFCIGTYYGELKSSTQGEQKWNRKIPAINLLDFAYSACWCWSEITASLSSGNYIMLFSRRQPTS